MPDWSAVCKEIAAAQKGDRAAFDTIRRKYTAKLHAATGRNLIAYYSGFLTKPQDQGISITDEDKNGFMCCIREMERDRGLDLFLHTSGGEIAATESLVHYLKEMFGDNIRAVVPQIAMSAGALLACSCDSILMGKHSNIGPVDPQLGGIPALGVLEELKMAYKEIKEDPVKSYVWNAILSKLPPSFIQQCHWATERSREFLKRTLEDGMLKDLPEPQKNDTIEKIVQGLTDLSFNKAHSRHIHYQECKDLGLKIELLEGKGKDELQDLVLTVHHCFIHTLANTPAIKIIENHRGRGIIRT